LEAESKLYVQSLLQQGEHELVWSYILEYENSMNPHEDRRSSTLKWKSAAITHCTQSEEIKNRAKGFEAKGLHPKDALHLACAVEVEADYFLTTDKRILNKNIEGIVAMNPIDFVRMEAGQ
jgi:predicted nucleic acid-binding protein